MSFSNPDVSYDAVHVLLSEDAAKVANPKGLLVGKVRSIVKLLK